MEPTTKMMLQGYFLAEFREAEDREPEGYQVRYSGQNYFQRLCRYEQDPVTVLLSTLDPKIQPFVQFTK